MQKVYYDTFTGKQVIDVSGKKDIDTIKKDFGDGDWQTIFIDEGKEVYEIKDGQLAKSSIKEKQEAKMAKKLAELQPKIDAIKAKLNLTDDDLKTLKEVL